MGENNKLGGNKKGIIDCELMMINIFLLGDREYLV